MTTKTTIEHEEEMNALRRKLELSSRREVSLEHEIGEILKVNEALRSQLYELKRRQFEPLID